VIWAAGNWKKEIEGGRERERQTNLGASPYRASDSFWDGREQIEEDGRVYETNCTKYHRNRRNLSMKMIDVGRKRSRCENWRLLVGLRERVRATDREIEFLFWLVSRFARGRERDESDRQRHREAGAFFSLKTRLSRFFFTDLQRMCSSFKKN